MADKFWKKSERRLAKRFGTTRTPLSGRGSRHTSGDIISNTLYVEHKIRKKMPFKQLLQDTEAKARREGKVALIVVRERGSPRWMAFLNLDDIPKVAEEMKAYKGEATNSKA